jgi:hypothetical protein
MRTASWLCRVCAPLKRRSTSTRLHAAISQKAVFFSVGVFQETRDPNLERTVSPALVTWPAHSNTVLTTLCDVYKLRSSSLRNPLNCSIPLLRSVSWTLLLTTSRSRRTHSKNTCSPTSHIYIQSELHFKRPSLRKPEFDPRNVWWTKWNRDRVFSECIAVSSVSEHSSNVPHRLRPNPQSHSEVWRICGNSTKWQPPH